jgi:NADPH-dependent ferric siderophore reductase
VSVARVAPRGTRLVRVTLTGQELDGFDIGLPASSVRLLVPRGSDEVVLPAWNGNEFLYDDGTRPAIRTLTPLRFDPATRELDVEVVLHGHGPLSAWAGAARPGDRAAISGTGRGYDIDPTAAAFVIAGDESALPAITLLLDALPANADVQVLLEVAGDDAHVDLPSRRRTIVQWSTLAAHARPGDALVAAVTAATIDPDVRVWAAGEAAAVHRIRRHLFEERGLPRTHAVIRGYWKYGRESTAGDSDA